MEKLPRTLKSFYPRWKPNAAQKDVGVLSCVFLKILPLQPHSYIILGGKIRPGKEASNWSGVAIKSQNEVFSWSIYDRDDDKNEYKIPR